MGGPSPAPKDFGLKSDVAHLEAGWSFKDSWVANLTLASTGFVALATSVDALTALLGEEPKAALAVATVAGLVSAAVIALANGVVKIFGESTAKVTVAGLLVSSAMVVFAATFQVVTVGLAVEGALTESAAQGLTIATMILVLLAVVGYAGTSIYQTVSNGAADDVPAIPEDAGEAWHAESEWQKTLVADRIRSLFKKWLAEDQSNEEGAALAWTYPDAIGLTSFGDDPPGRRTKASIL